MSEDFIKNKLLLRRKDPEVNETRQTQEKLKLENSAITKIRTTMIGALAAFEKKFEFLWDSDELTDEQLEMKNLYEEARQEILDLGNLQIRNIKTEMKNYTVDKKLYKMNFTIGE